MRNAGLGEDGRVGGGSRPGGGTGSGDPTVEIVIPVFNESAAVEHSVRALRSYLDAHFPFPSVVTIADNASTDDTWEIAARLAAQLRWVRAVHLPAKGRGLALKAVWSASTAQVMAYMDVDLSTDLDAVLPLVAPLISGHSDIAIGSRLARGAHVVRGPKREAISRVYNLIIRVATGNRFTDAQCGFKAVRADVAHRLLPLVEDDGWFFDTELLVLAEHNGLRIHEVPVDWVDDPDSRVDLVATAMADLRGLWRVSRSIAAGSQEIEVSAVPGGDSRPLPSGGEDVAARFVTIGGVSTVAYLALLLVLHVALGLVAANAVSLTACAAANTAAHWRVLRHSSAPTPGRAITRSRAATAAAITWAGGLALSTVALVAAGALTSSIVAALLAVVAANAVVSVARFLLLRAVVYRHHLAALTDGPRERRPVGGRPGLLGASPSDDPTTSAAAAADLIRRPPETVS